KIPASIVLSGILGVALVAQLVWIAVAGAGAVAVSLLYSVTAIVGTMQGYAMTEGMKQRGDEIGEIARRIRPEKSVLLWHLTNLAMAALLFLGAWLVRYGMR